MSCCTHFRGKNIYACTFFLYKIIKNRLRNFSNVNGLFNYSEVAQGLRHSAVLARADALAHAAPTIPNAPLPGPSLGAFLALLIMCAAGDGGHATLILTAQLRKVPFLPAQKENNKEPSVAAACGAQRTHQNTSKRRSSPPVPSQPAIHPSMHDSSPL